MIAHAKYQRNIDIIVVGFSSLLKLLHSCAPIGENHLTGWGRARSEEEGEEG